MLQRPARTILVVDDSASVLAMTSDYLKDHGLRTLTAGDGESALEKARDARPDLILLDVMMQGMDGFETCRRLKADEELRDIPVIFMTALDNPQDKVRGFAAGAVDYLGKPIQHEELLARTTTHLRIHTLNAELEKRVAEQTAELRAANEKLRRKVEEQKGTARALNESEERFRTVVEQAGDAFFLTTLDGKILEVNRRGCDVLGYSRDELLAMTLTDIDVEIESHHHKERFWDKLTPGEYVTLEGRNRRKDGSEFPVEVRVGLIELGGDLFMLGLARNITERKRAEARIERLNQLEESLLRPGNPQEKAKRITDGVIDIFDADFARIWLTRSGDRCDSGCPHAKVIQGPHICRHRDRCLHLLASSGRYTHIDGKMHRRVPFGSYKIGRVAAGHAPGFLTNDVTHDPEVHDHGWARRLGLVSFAGCKVQSTDGNTIGVLALFSKHAISSDEVTLLETVAGITSQVIRTTVAEEALAEYREQLEELVKERTRQLEAAQEELIRKERLAALGQLIASVAHEIRNPLGTIRSSMFVIGRTLGGKDLGIREDLERARRNVIRCDAIIEELLEFVRAKRLSLTPTALDDYIGGILDEQTIPDGIDLIRRLTSGSRIPLDPERFQSCVINVVANACHAMTSERGSGGQLTVETARSADRVEIRIADTGVGIGADDLARVFEPLYSTKSFGVGLGLPIVRQIMERHHGGVEIASRPDEGTTVTLWLPADRGERRHEDLLEPIEQLRDEEPKE
ncbi:MAG: PAS domain S-box protein [bacterium]|nr:PAS domain S-box protein [bacterium]